jgi:hypothetical protein
MGKGALRGPPNRAQWPIPEVATGPTGTDML